MLSTREAPARAHYRGRLIQPFSDFPVEEHSHLDKLGVGFHGDTLDEMVAYDRRKNRYTMDSANGYSPSITTGSIPVPIQFLQKWIPGFIYVATFARTIDSLVGMTLQGEWYDEEIVMGVMERLGTSVPYSDTGNIPRASWNLNWNYRTVIRFEEGCRTGVLEQARTAKVNVDSGAMRRDAAIDSLEIQRNAVGFYGFNAGNNNTYGFLNDPGLPAYVTVANGASGSPLWSRKTFLEIQQDIRSWAAALQVSSGGSIDPRTTPMTLVLSTASIEYMAVTTDLGVSVEEWVAKTYPSLRVVAAPELTAANGGANVAYFYAENVQDASTDNGRTFDQYIQAKFMVVGVQQMAKGYEEDYSNATAGVVVKRPWAVYCASGM